MNFVQQLEECLRDLAAASRQKHPGVKEASERAVMKLRSLQNDYVSAVRKATSSNRHDKHPTTALFQSSDLLHPFLLACNYPNAEYSMLEIAFRAMRLLMEADAIVPNDGIHMVRVYQIQAQVVTAFYQKQYAKEIQKTAAAAAAAGDDDKQATTKHSDDGTTETASIASGSAASSSWFNWGSSGGAKGAQDITGGSSKMAIKNAVSSSTGKTGQAALSGTHMEKLALEILSSLLQLMEGLKRYPNSLSAELWTNSMSLACLWFFLPARHTVQQAAHSTVSQIISLLYQTDDTSKLSHTTWEDLLAMTESERKRRPVNLAGAFKLCKKKTAADVSSSTNIAVPPSAEFALELMTQIWKEMTRGDSKFEPSDALIIKTMGVTMNMLKKLPSTSVEKSLRVVQWTSALFQAHTGAYFSECRELFVELIKQIPVATEACRKHHDFEDGYVYDEHHESDLFGNNSASAIMDESVNSTAAVSKEHQKRRLHSETLNTCFPSAELWKAGFVLEFVYHVVDGNTGSVFTLLDDGSTVQGVMEALSDFATIGTSCRDHMLQLVGFCDTQDHSSIKPTVFRKAEHCVAAGMNFLEVSSPSSSKNSEKGNQSSTQILGETLWLSLQCMVQVSECLVDVDAKNKHKSLVSDIFSPLLAVLQHILKRFIGSEELVRLALKGYSTLADICLPLDACAVERKVLLTSLCKLSLPSWGKHDTSSLLLDHHVRSLLCLLRIVHLYFDSIASEWEIILWTFEELSVLEVASPLLSDEAYHASLAISAVYTRIASFTTCFTDSSLICMAEALADICEATMSKRDVVGDSETVLPERIVTSDAGEKLSEEERGSISGKIMSMGVRAIYGQSSSDVGKKDDLHRDRIKKLYYGDYRDEFVSRLSASKAKIRTNTIGRIPFVLMLLSDLAMANGFRPKECGDKLSVQLSRLADSSPVTRPFVMDLMTMLMMSELATQGALPLQQHGRGRIVFQDPMHSQLLAVAPVENTSGIDQRGSSQVETLEPLCESIQTTEKAEVAKSSLEVLNTILEGTGQNLEGEVWPMMIDAIASLSGDSSYKIDRTSSAWSQSCLLAFRSLKLIVDDFFDQLPDSSDPRAKAHTSLLDCCASFVTSRHDINTSLTAIGLLWTIADQDADSAAIDRALSKMVLLSSDERPEVRNAAVNTLFSCIVGRGGSFTPDYWQDCITGTVFDVYDIVAAKAGAGAIQGDAEGKSESRYQVRLHHSRDSAGKMWAATQVLVLRGLSRVLRNFFDQLLMTCDVKNKKSHWFVSAWKRILHFALQAAGQGQGRESLDIRSVGVELLVLCGQLSSKAGIHAAMSPARVGTNMEVVNGALRSVRETQVQKATPSEGLSDGAEYARQELFLHAFKCLETFEDQILKHHVADDDTDVQILQRFGSNLKRLYDCCRGEEFTVDEASLALAAFKRYRKDKVSEKEDHIVARFVSIVRAVLKSSGGDPKSRFLNQGQRVSLDLLRSMASDGSFHAFENLVDLAGQSFTVRKDSDGDESEAGEEESTKSSSTLLNFEAASAVSHGILEEKVSDECKAVVLYMILTDFLEGINEESNSDMRPRRYYKQLVPIIRNGLKSSARLDSDIEGARSAVDSVWSQSLKCLSYMFTPIPLYKDLMKIARVPEVTTIVKCTGECIPQRFIDEYCVILSFGATKAFGASRQHAVNAETNPESDFGRKSKRHRDDLLKLFSVCFLGCCAARPEETGLRTVAETILSGAHSETSDSMRSLCTEASLLVCSAIQENERMDALIISIFPSLCQLIISGSSKLKHEAGKILMNANIAETLRSSQNRYEIAEKRAAEAESKVQKLEARIVDLENQKAKQQEDAAKEALNLSIWNLG